MIVIYGRLTNQEIDEGVEELKSGITKFFLDNPKRRVCRVSLWYDRSVTVNRKNVHEAIDREAAKAKAENA